MPIFELARSSTLPPSTIIGRLKSTFSIRESVMVVVPHSASARPDATVSSRFAASTGCQTILSAGSFNACWIEAATAAHSSAE